MIFEKKKFYFFLKLNLLLTRQKYIAGIFLLIGGAVIPPFMPSKIFKLLLIEFDGMNPIQPFI